MCPPRSAALSFRNPNAPGSSSLLRFHCRGLRYRCARCLQLRRGSGAYPRPWRALRHVPCRALQRARRARCVPATRRVFRLVGKRPGGHHRPERHCCCAAGLRYLGCAHLVFAFSVLLDPRAGRCPRRCELVDPDEDRQRRRRVRFPRIPAAYLWGDSATALLPSAAHFSAVLADGGAVLPARGRPQPAPRESASPRGTGGVCLRDFAAARPADWLPVPAAVGATERTHH